MSRLGYKKVSIEVEVPKGDNCWDGHVSCDYFDNEGGHGYCELLGEGLSRNDVGYKKCFKCRTSKDVQ